MLPSLVGSFLARLDRRGQPQERTTHMTPCRRLPGIVLTSFVLALLCVGAQRALAQPSIQLQLVVGGLDLPIGIVNAADGSGRLFVVLQRGKIVADKNGQVQSPAFLDLTGLV